MAEKRSVLWKIYFYFILVFIILILGLLFIPIDGEKNIDIYYYTSDLIYDMFSMLLFFITIVGLWGFINKKIIFNREFWILIFFINLIDLVGTFISGDFRDEYILYGYLIVLIITMPIYIGLYFYIFKMKLLWSEINE